MEGFNPDQSLIPSVGGSITPMSGGGQTGGEQNTDPMKLDGYNIVGLEEATFKSSAMQSVLKQLAPSIFASVADVNQLWTDNFNTDNSNIKNAIFERLIDNYITEVEQGLTIQTTETIDEAYIKEQLMKDESINFSDTTKAQMKFNTTHLTIEILTQIPKKPIQVGGDNSEEEFEERFEEEEDSEEEDSEEEDSEEDIPFGREAEENSFENENPFGDNSDENLFNNDQESE